MSTDATHSIGDVPTEPGWYRAKTGLGWCCRLLGWAPGGGFRTGALIALVEGRILPLEHSMFDGCEWGSRVEFPGDEPAAVGLSDECESAAATLRKALHNQRNPSIPATRALHVLLDEIIRIQKRAEEPRPGGELPTVRDMCVQADGRLHQLGRCTAQAGEALGVPDPSVLSWSDVLDEARKLRAPAAGPLTPDSEGWWWRWGHAVGQFDEGYWGPMCVTSGSSGVPAPGLVYEYGWVTEDGCWGGRAVPPVTPAVEADEREADPQRNQLPPGWTIERLEHGAWWCAERATPPIPVTGFSRAQRVDAIAAAWECVRKREAEPQDDPMAAKGADLNAVGRRLGVLRRYKSPDWETDEAFRGRLASAGGVRRWAWVEACPEGERREQTMYVGGDAVEDRVVDRKDEP